MVKEVAKNRRFSDEKTERWLKYAGDFPIGTIFLSTKKYDSMWGILKIVNALLRGYGHIVFANNPFTGLLIVIALFWADYSAALVGLYSEAIGLLVSILLRLSPQEAVDSGATIFNNILFGLVSGSLLPGHYGITFELHHWLYVTIGAVLCVFVSSALATFFESIGKLRLLAFALPFNVVQFIFFTCVVTMHSTHLSNTSISQGELNITNTEAISAQLLNTNLSQILPDDDLLKNRNKGIVRATDNMEFLRNVVNASSGVQLSLPLRQAADKNDSAKMQLAPEIEAMVSDNSNATVSGIDYKNGNTATYRNNTSIDASMDETSMDSGLQRNNNQGEVNISDISNKTSDDIVIEETFLNESSDVADTDLPIVISQQALAIDVPSHQNKEEESPSDIEEIFNILSNETDMALDLNNSTHGITRRKRNATKENEETEFVDIGHDATLLDWGKVFAGIILSMTQAFGFCHVQASLMMYLGILICSPITAAFCLAGAIIGTITGIALSEAPYAEVYAGVWGFNGMLSAGALGGFCYVVTWQSTITTLACAFFTTVLQKCLMLAFEEANMPVLSLPFNLSAILFLCVTSADARRLPRPDALSFPEKHMYLFNQKVYRDEEEEDVESPPPTERPLNLQDTEETTLKRAPLAEPEVF